MIASVSGFFFTNLTIPLGINLETSPDLCQLPTVRKVRPSASVAATVAVNGLTFRVIYTFAPDAGLSQEPPTPYFELVIIYLMSSR
jgi:hypothetical protein